MQGKFVSLCAMASILGIHGIAGAQNLIVNPSFEVDNSERVNGPVTGWTFQADEQAGVISANTSTYFPTNSSGADGSYIGFFNNSGSAQVAQAFPSTPPVASIAANTTYTLTVALGNEVGTGNYKDTGNFRIQFYDNAARSEAGTTYLITQSDPIAPPDGTLTDYSISFTTGAAATDTRVGLPLIPQIQLFSVDNNGAHVQSPFDNVRLTATAVPEPAALSLVGMGAMAFLRRRRA
jgi:PEP-CTERM motif